MSGWSKKIENKTAHVCARHAPYRASGSCIAPTADIGVAGITVNTDGIEGQRCGLSRAASRFCRLRFCYALVVGSVLDAGRYCYALVVGTVLDAGFQHDARSSQYDLASPSFSAERR